MLHPEWLNQNEHRAYPFREDSSLEDTTGTITLPTGLVLDFLLTVEGSSDFNVSLTSLTKAGTFFSLVFSDSTGATVVTASVNSGLYEYGNAVALSGVDPYTSARGRVVFGRLEDIDTDIPDGVYAFSGIEMEPCTVRPDLRAVRSIRVGSTFGETAGLYGDVSLIAGRNVQLQHLPQYNAIQINADTDDNYTEECDCESSLATGRIHTINGISASDIELVGGSGVKLERSGNKLTISSPGVVPCCSCTELEAVNDELDRLRGDTNQLVNYADSVEKTLTSIQAKLASL